jgi:hypothetical protein
LPPPPPELPEFIFGALSTEGGCGNPGEAVVIRARVGVDLALVSVELRYSTDPAVDPACDGHG